MCSASWFSTIKWATTLKKRLIVTKLTLFSDKSLISNDRLMSKRRRAHHEISMTLSSFCRRRCSESWMIVIFFSTCSIERKIMSFSQKKFRLWRRFFMICLIALKIRFMNRIFLRSFFRVSRLLKCSKACTVDSSSLKS